MTALALTHIAKRFGDTRALDDASLGIAPGRVHALLGENGAGKTTLMRIAYGLLQPDAGTITVDEQPVRFRSAADAIEHGIGMVHQHFTAVSSMSVAENVALGRHGRFDRERARQHVRDVTERTGLPLEPDAIAGSLPVSAQQRLEIVKALARGARVLLLDEPTAVLAPSEARELAGTIRRLADGGAAIVLITHKLREALTVADEVTVLRRGRTVLHAESSQTSERDLVDAMLGAEQSSIAEHTEKNDAAAGDKRAVLSANAIRVRDARGVDIVRGATLALSSGEIVGLAAVEGSGQHELVRALARLQPIDAGTITRDGRVAFIPEDRQRDALALPMSLTENVALRGAGARSGLMAWSDVQRETTRLLAAYDVRAPGPTTAASALSGGNQQKLVLARELDAWPDGRPAVIIAENPTRGLDIAATAATHARLREARDAGAAVLVYSSDLDEVLALADRIVVMYAGTLHDLGPSPDRETVGRAMLGAS